MRAQPKTPCGADRVVKVGDIDSSTDWHSALRDVDAVVQSPGVVMMVVNSVCGCAAAKAITRLF